MSQVLTPEEMAALLEGLRETEDRPVPAIATYPRGSGQEAGFSLKSIEMSGCHNLSNWLMELADLRWPHL